jgi:hypothetical protein
MIKFFKSLCLFGLISYHQIAGLFIVEIAIKREALKNYKETNSRLSSQFVNFGYEMLWLVFTGLLLQGRWGLSIPISVIWGTLPRGNSRLCPSWNHSWICCEAQNSNKHLTATNYPLTQIPCKHVVRSLTIFGSFFSWKHDIRSDAAVIIFF